MPNAEGPVEVHLLELGGEFTHLSLLFANDEASVSFNSDPSRVVSPVLQALQPVKQKWFCLSITDVSYDAAHATCWVELDSSEARNQAEGTLILTACRIA